MIEYKCPYCGQNNYADKTKGLFNNWLSVIRHTSKCKNNNHEYVIHKNFGPIHYTELNTLSNRELRIKYPNISIGELNRTLRRNNINIKNIVEDNTWSKDKIILFLQRYYKEYGKIPSYRDLDSGLSKSVYPSTASLKKYFGSFNAAIEAAGFIPNIQNGYGIDTYGLDGHLYRSQSEAYFADNYLYNIYEYIIEPNYPSPFSYWKYDWYVPSLDLYLELDGGLRPERIKEKIALNNNLNRSCLFLKIDDIYKHKNMQQILG